MKSTVLSYPRVLIFLVIILTAAGLNAVPNPDGWEQFGLKYTVESMTVSGDGYYEPVTYEFGMEGQLRSETRGSTSYTYQYEYENDDWNISKMTRYYNDEPLQQTRFEYNAKGQLIKAIVYTMPDEDLPREEYVFDTSGRLTESRFVTFMKANNTTARYSYNAAGQMIRSDEWMDGENIGWTTFRNDDHGNVIEEKTYFNDTDPPSVINYKYRYDDHGNITRVEKSGDVDPGVTAYSYRYYEVVDGGY
jgi:hypothetical protein